MPESRLLGVRSSSPEGAADPARRCATVRRRAPLELEEPVNAIGVTELVLAIVSAPVGEPEPSILVEVRNRTDPVAVEDPDRAIDTDRRSAPVELEDPVR